MAHSTSLSTHLEHHRNTTNAWSPLLREHPEGLTPTEMRGLLRADRRLTDTWSGMFRDGLLRRVGRGRFVVA
jgi:hypothetical protein